MRKVRYLNTVDYGVYEAGKQHSVHAGSGPNGVSSDVPKSWIQSQLAWLQSGALTGPIVSDAALSGSEVFESTTRKRPIFNECFHTYDRSLNYLSSFWWLPYGTSRPSWLRGMRFKTPPLLYTPADDLSFDTISSNIQAEAYHTMIPRFEGDISMVNFIFEMKDFRDISNLLTAKTFKWMDALGINGQTLSAGTKRVAELHLLNNFVIDPATADLSQMVFQAQKLVMDVQDEFRNKGLLPNIRHFSKPLNQSQTFVNYDGIVTADHIRLLEGSKSSSMFTATMEGDYGYTSRTGLDAFLKYWGLALTAEAVWNALPFSFMVDYFLSIGHSLNAMRHDKNVKYHVRQYSESLLTTKELGIFARAGTLNHARRALYINDNFQEIGNNRDKSYHISGIRSTNYKRRVTTPYWGPFLPRWKIPSSKQGLNMAALLRCLI